MLRRLVDSIGVGRVVLAAGLALGLSAGAATAAQAADEEKPPEVRWSVVPATPEGPDGRTSVETTLEPGEQAHDYFAVRNAGEHRVEFRLTAADGFFTRNGRFDILPAGQESSDAGTWISVPETVSVAAGATVMVPFTVAVPDTALPGDHAAGITASIQSVQSGEDGAAVAVESRVGFRITTRVAGDIAPRASVGNIAGEYALSWNPLRPGDMTVSFDIVNEGNTILRAQGSVDAGGRSIAYPAAGENPQELLPGDSRTIDVVVRGVAPLFVVSTRATLSPISVAVDGSTITLAPIASEVIVWAVPWPQLILILALALLGYAVVWGRLRARRRIALLIEEAREQGRQERL